MSEPPGEPAGSVSISNLGFRYRDGDFTLRVPELQVARGEALAFIGPSGSGKTTLLHLIAGIVTATTGRVVTEGVELATLAEPARRDFRVGRVGLVFQEFELLEYLTVLDNVLLPYRINPTLHFNESVRARTHELADRLGIAKLLSRRPAQLSQGERQRAAAAGRRTNRQPRPREQSAGARSALRRGARTRCNAGYRHPRSRTAIALRPRAGFQTIRCE